MNEGRSLGFDSSRFIILPFTHLVYFFTLQLIKSCLLSSRWLSRCDTYDLLENNESNAVVLGEMCSNGKEGYTQPTDGMPLQQATGIDF